MRLSAWLGTPRRLVGLTLLVTLVPSVLLVTLGWRLFQEDRAGALRELRERRERAADLVVAALERSSQGIEQKLAHPDGPGAFTDIDETPGAATVLILADRVDVRPAGQLAFAPYLQSDQASSDYVFAPGEALEFRREDPAAAAAWFRALADRAEPSVRPGALLRLARNLRKVRAYDEALAAYATTADLPPTNVAGVPSDLFARWARGELLASLGRDDELRQTGRALLMDLRRGRWTITRAAYELHAADAVRWSGEPTPAPTNAESLASVVDDLWRAWRSRPAAADVGNDAA